MMILRTLRRLPLVILLSAGAGAGAGVVAGESVGEPARESSCTALRRGDEVELRSPYFVLRLDVSSGLSARSFENLRTGTVFPLGGGSELEVVTGSVESPRRTDAWTLTSLSLGEGGPDGEAVFRLAASDPPLGAVITYRWRAGQPTLHKWIEIENRGTSDVLVLDARLGNYRTGARAVEREQGFPVYVDDEVFFSLAHPAGWAAVREGAVILEQHPGRTLASGVKLACMEAVYGTGERGKAREAFVAHLRSRMRRVVRGHDRPYAIFDNFGSWENDITVFAQNSEARQLHSLERLAESGRRAGVHFDICNIHFWVDHEGDLKRFDPKRFPRGIEPIREKLLAMGVRPGLWIDSSMRAWTIGRNPVADASTSEDPGWFCRASEPIRSMYVEAFRHHIRENGVRLIKFDNLRTVCNNPRHGHLGGAYSTEAIVDSVIEFLRALDAECPDVFLILYWGHRSPWWLLHGDTLFDSGIGIEAASPANQPALRARDSVTQKLDQAQRVAADVPPLGKDSLGVWLSDWGWNSSIGKERWAEGLVMDLARGSLLAQIWADRDWLSPPEWVQLADLLALFRARPECFGNSRFILGDPGKDEPYGYSLSDGHRAFFAIHNASWQDSRVSLTLGPAWGLPSGRTWDLYRWHPEPARLSRETSSGERSSGERSSGDSSSGETASGDTSSGDTSTFAEDATLALRPFDIVLLEAVPAGEAPSLDRRLPTRPIPVGFTEPTRALEARVRRAERKVEEVAAIWTTLEPRSAVSAGGACLTVGSDRSILASGPNPTPDSWTLVLDTDLPTITAFRLEVLDDPSLPRGGPGRAVNGNFALNEISLSAAPRDGNGAPIPVSLKSAKADFSQTTHGGWPVTAAIDGDPRTAWSIHPQTACPHVAVFELGEPIRTAKGATLTVTLGQGYAKGELPRDHAVGRLRLAVTDAPLPVPLPEGYGSVPLVVAVLAPPSAGGGTLAIAVEMRKEGVPFAINDIGSSFEASAKVSGKSVECRPVLGKATYPSPWQAWRIELEPSAEARPIELAALSGLSPDADFAWRAWFVPAER